MSKESVKTKALRGLSKAFIYKLRSKFTYIKKYSRLNFKDFDVIDSIVKILLYIVKSVLNKYSTTS